MASFRDSDLKLICKPDPVLLEDQSSETSSERHKKTVVLLTFFYKISCRSQVDKTRNNERKEDLKHIYFLQTAILKLIINSSQI